MTMTKINMNLMKEKEKKKIPLIYILKTISTTCDWKKLQRSSSNKNRINFI